MLGSCMALFRMRSLDKGGQLKQPFWRRNHRKTVLYCARRAGCLIHIRGFNLPAWVDSNSPGCTMHNQPMKDQHAAALSINPVLQSIEQPKLDTLWIKWNLLLEFEQRPRGRNGRFRNFFRSLHWRGYALKIVIATYYRKCSGRPLF